MEDIKIYYPNEITDNPIGMDESNAVEVDYTKNAAYVESAGVIPENSIYTGLNATDVVSVSIDTTRSRILGTYTFSESGSIQIGKYVNGVSGQIQITPDGITATNSSGTNTFNLDGTTGDATFYGTIAAGSIVAGYVKSVGGDYTTSSSIVSRVALLPDANTGIIAYSSDGTSVVFKVTIGGTDVGDVQLGNYGGGTGILWDQSAAKLFIKGDMTAGNISGVTITGSTINTGTTGTRVEMSANGDNIKIYDSGNSVGLTIGLSGTSISEITSSDSRALQLTSASGSQIEIKSEVDMNNNAIVGASNVTSGTFNSTSNVRFPGYIYLDSSGTTRYIYSNGSEIQFGGTIDSFAMSGSIDMNGNDITEIDELRFNTTSSNYNNANWEIWAYNSTEKGFRCRVDGNLYQFDLTSK